MPDAITNDAGEIALKVYPPTQILVQETPSGKGYLFHIKANIALAWIDPQDVENIMARKKKGCCPGSVAHRYIYASEDDARRWQNGGGR